MLKALMNSAKFPALLDDELLSGVQLGENNALSFDARLLGVRLGELGALSVEELLLRVRLGELGELSVEELLIGVLLVTLPRGFRGDGGDLGLGEESLERNVMVRFCFVGVGSRDEPVLKG
jgi:hypothetical protein